MHHSKKSKCFQNHIYIYIQLYPDCNRASLSQRFYIYICIYIYRYVFLTVYTYIIQRYTSYSNTLYSNIKDNIFVVSLLYITRQYMSIHVYIYTMIYIYIPQKKTNKKLVGGYALHVLAGAMPLDPTCFWIEDPSLTG